jgi:hypothetical protein
MGCLQNAAKLDFFGKNVNSSYSEPLQIFSTDFQGGYCSKDDLKTGPMISYQLDTGKIDCVIVIEPQEIDY